MSYNIKVPHDLSFGEQIKYVKKILDFKRLYDPVVKNEYVHKLSPPIFNNFFIEKVEK